MSATAEKLKVEFNLFQMVLTLAPQEFVVAECGRGTGKSTVLGQIFKEAALQLKRGKCALSGVSYQSMLADTLPSTIQGLEKLGWYKDVHYFIGRRSPDPRWPEPFEPPSNTKAWANMIHFFTGFCVVLISQDPGKPESRGHNFDMAIADEAAQQNEKRLGNEVFAAVRTWRPEFRGLPMYHKKYFVSSTPVKPEGLWFLKYEDLARRFPEKYAFISADSRFNATNLKPGWVEDQRQNMTEAQFNAEIMNKRPRLTVNGYYPMLRPETHYYGARDPVYRANVATYDPLANDCRRDGDVAPDRPLIMSFDPGHAINVLNVFQLHRGDRELRCVRDFWLPYPSIIQDLFETQVVPWYQSHQRKTVYLFFDRTAYSGKADAKHTTADIVSGILRRAGWNVITLARRGVITQHSKYHDIANVMNEGPDRGKDQLLVVRINKDHARDTTISLERAEAKQNSKNQIQKVKLSEKRAASVPAEHSTHLSDSFDLPVEYYAKVAANRANGSFMDISMR